jgi:hypothetical protein
MRRWWRQMGEPIYPKAARLSITADCGGSNGYRVRLRKVALQRFADETGILLQVRHLPPGTSKWKKIEHRMFCHITTQKGLKIGAEIDASSYPTGKIISDEALSRVQLRADAFHGEWNYAILPNTNS